MNHEKRGRRMKKRSKNRDTPRRIDLRWLVSLFCVSPSNFSFCSSSVLQIKEEGQGNSNFSTVWLSLSVQNLMPFDFLSLYCLVIGLQVSVKGNSLRVSLIRHSFSFPKKRADKSLLGRMKTIKQILESPDFDPWVLFCRSCGFLVIQTSVSSSSTKMRCFLFFYLSMTLLFLYLILEKRFHSRRGNSS